MINYTEKESSNDQKIVDIQGTHFRKCFGIGLTIVSSENSSQKLNILLKDTKFTANQGQTAIKFENLNGNIIGRYDYRESNLTNNYQSTN